MIDFSDEKVVRIIRIGKNVLKYLGYAYLSLGVLFMTISIDTPLGKQIILPVIEKNKVAQDDIGAKSLSLAIVLLLISWVIQRFYIRHHEPDKA